jgi:MFS family permease
MATETKPATSTGIWRTFRESSLAVKAILAGIFVNRVGGFLNIFLVLFLTSKGYSTQQATTALGVYGVGSVVGVLVGGALADRLGARNATVLGTASSALLVASLLYLPHYPLLLGAVAALGLLSQIYRPASATLLSDLTPADRQVMIFAMYRFCLNLGTTAAPLLGFGLYDLNHHSYTLVFWGEAAVALVYALIALVALPARRATGTAESAEATPEPGSYRTVLRDRRYVLYLFAMFFNAVVYVQYLSTLPLDVKAAGLTLFWYTLAVSLNGLAVIAFELPLTKFSQTLPFKLTIGLAFALVGVGNAFYGLPLVPATIVIGTLIWTLGEIIGAPSAFAYPAVAGPPQLKGHYIGSFQFMFGAGSAVGPVIGGLLFVWLGHHFWPVIAIASAISCLLAVAGVQAGRATAAAPEDADGTTGSEPTTGPTTGPATTEPVTHVGAAGQAESAS